MLNILVFLSYKMNISWICDSSQRHFKVIGPVFDIYVVFDSFLNWTRSCEGKVTLCPWLVRAVILMERHLNWWKGAVGNPTQEWDSSLVRWFNADSGAKSCSGAILSVSIQEFNHGGRVRIMASVLNWVSIKIVCHLWG